MTKSYDPIHWYWIVAGDTTRVYSAQDRDYMPVTVPDYVSWINDGTMPATIDSEYNMGRLLAPNNTLRPIPAGILEGYLDEQAKLIALQPDFKLWLDLYKEVIHPTPTDAQIRARIRSRL